ncbi:hypothetical protein [Streptomyces sp.]|uniref:hypothetical protein n=1 Tax=Streptomyces sp. TaxID=1931 RepID=UPI002F4032B0
MAALAWLLIPLLAACAAALWGRWATHSRSAGDGASLAGYERFRQAMQNSAPASARYPVHRNDAPPGADGEEGSPAGPVAGPVP